MTTFEEWKEKAVIALNIGSVSEPEIKKMKFKDISEFIEGDEISSRLRYLEPIYASNEARPSRIKIVNVVINKPINEVMKILQEAFANNINRPAKEFVGTREEGRADNKTILDWTDFTSRKPAIQPDPPQQPSTTTNRPYIKKFMFKGHFKNKLASLVNAFKSALRRSPAVGPQKENPLHIPYPSGDPRVVHAKEILDDAGYQVTKKPASNNGQSL